MVEQNAQPKGVPVREPWLQRVFNYMFGFDFFISYRWKDGREYALVLDRELRKEKYTCFLDSGGFQLGIDTTIASRDALQITRALILVGTPGALDSDSVLMEVTDFGKLKRPIFPIDIGRSLAGSPNSKLVQELGGPNALRASEDESRRQVGPSDEVLKSVRTSFKLTKQYTKRVRWFATAAVVFAIIAVVAVWLGVSVYFSEKRAHAAQLTAAEADYRSGLAEGEKQKKQALALFARGSKAHGENDPLTARVFFAHSLAIWDTLQTRKRMGECSTALTRWCWATQRIPASFCGHGGEVMVVVVTADGQQVISGGKDKTLRGWELRTGKPLWVVQTPTEINALAVATDARTAVTGGLDGRTRVWNLTTKVQKMEVPIDGEVTGIAFRPDDREVAVTTRPRKIGPGMVVLFDPETGKIRREFRAAIHRMQAVAYDPGVGWLLSSGGAVRNGGGTLFLLPVADAEDEVKGLKMRRLLDLPHLITSVACPRDARFVVFGAADGRVYQLEMEKGEVTVTEGRHEGPVESIAVSPDGVLIASAGEDGTVRLWSAIERKQLAVLRGHRGPVHSVAFSKDRMVVSAGSDGTIRAWQMENFNPLVLNGHDHIVSAVAFLRDDRVVSASWDNSTRIWDASSGDQLNYFKSASHVITHCQFALSRDPARLVTAEALQKGVRIRNLELGGASRTFGNMPFIGGSVAISPDGALVAFGSGKGELSVWDEKTAKLRYHTSLAKDTLDVVSFSADGGGLAAGSKEGTVFLVDQRTGRALSDVAFGQHINDLQFDPAAKGRLIAVALEDGTVRIWDLEDKNEVHRINYLAFALAYHPSGRWMALAKSEAHVRVQDVRVWDLATDTEVARLRGHGDRLQAVAFSPDGSRLASASADNSIRVWRLESLFQSLTLSPDSLIRDAESKAGIWLPNPDGEPESLPAAQGAAPQ